MAYVLGALRPMAGGLFCCLASIYSLQSTAHSLILCYILLGVAFDEDAVDELLQDLDRHHGDLYDMTQKIWTEPAFLIPPNWNPDDYREQLFSGYNPTTTWVKTTKEKPSNLAVSPLKLAPATGTFGKMTSKKRLLESSAVAQEKSRRQSLQPAASLRPPLGDIASASQPHLASEAESAKLHSATQQLQHEAPSDNSQVPSPQQIAEARKNYIDHATKQDHSRVASTSGKMCSYGCTGPPDGMRLCKHDKCGAWSHHFCEIAHHRAIHGSKEGSKGGAKFVPCLLHCEKCLVQMLP